MNAYKAGLGLLILIGVLAGTQTGSSSPPCWSKSPNRPGTCFTTTTTTSTLVVTGVTIDASQFPVLRAVTSPAGSVATTFQWQQGDSFGATFNDITGATFSTYTVAAGDTGHSYRVTADGVTSTPYGVTVSAGRLFTGDFNQYSVGLMRNQSIAPWSYISDPDPASANPPQIVVDPLGSGEKVLAVTVDPTDTIDTVAGAASRSDIVGPHSFNTNGLEIWWMFEMMFPSQVYAGVPKFIPTNGDWNWNMQWHAETVGGVGEQPFAMGMATGSTALPPVSCGGNEASNVNPQLYYKLNGGDITNGTKLPTTRVCTLKVITYDHWYTILAHRIWSTLSNGIQETWIDGTLVNSTQRATLFRDASTGAVDNPFFELGNYRWGGQVGGVNWSSTIYYKKFRIGTTLASVQ
jgi:hypothetical protein